MNWKVPLTLFLAAATSITGAMPFSDKESQRLPYYFNTAGDITPRRHMDVQAAAQKWIYSSIPTTAKVPTGNLPPRLAQEVEACATFRFNPVSCWKTAA